MRKHKGFIVALVVCLVFFGAARAMASNPEADLLGEGGPGLGYLILKAFMKLDLTDDQEHDIAVILKQNRDETRDLGNKMMKARKELMKLTTADQANEQAIRQAVRQVAVYGEELAVRKARGFQEIRKVLTPEQQAILQELRGEITTKGKEKLRAGLSLLDAWINARIR